MNGMGEESSSATESEASSAWDVISQTFSILSKALMDQAATADLVRDVLVQNPQAAFEKKIGQAFTFLH